MKKTHPLSIELLEPRIALAIITVTSTGDTVAADGFVTLREAIIAANTNAVTGDAPAGDPGLDEIDFNIAGAGVQTISPTAALPNFTEPLTIDGYTQPGAAANLNDTGTIATILIEINGASAPLSTNGLVSLADATTIRGLAITGFKQSGAGGSNGIGILLSGQGPDRGRVPPATSRATSSGSIRTGSALGRIKAAESCCSFRTMTLSAATRPQHEMSSLATVPPASWSNPAET
ncbi:MAG TPA: CSLREA domain-containing protein [Gemmataceae bacterium]|jgi:CSLREA domain-containing protein|nr:CSLREA domain-containing protein [Gemmataceae bacterium]